jgi:spectinomycin phosphotransferase
MLERPDIRDETIADGLHREFGLSVVHISFLPLGADRNTAVYRVVADDETPYFAKLRRGTFDEIAVTLPKYLSDQGIAPIVAPLSTRAGQLWANLDAFKLVLYPFVEGRNGYEVNLSDRAWIDLGRALKRIHNTVLPTALYRRIPQETYSPQWREKVSTLLEHTDDWPQHDPVAAQLASFFQAKCTEVLDLVGRAERLARALTSRSPPFVLCHSDMHAGNLLIDSDGAVYIVDWDNPILAPKERDLMFIGAGHMGAWRKPQDEQALFYRGYGDSFVDPVALAYYRYERIVEDIAVFSERILLATEGTLDREQCLEYLQSSFLPNGVLEIAYASDQTRMDR